jgi:hypothetical protein
VSLSYEFTISGEASRLLFGSTDRIRAKVEDIFSFLAKHPMTKGDFEELTPGGRILQVKVFENVIVTYWADHAVRELRILRCEVVDGKN